MEIHFPLVDGGKQVKTWFPLLAKPARLKTATHDQRMSNSE